VVIAKERKKRPTDFVNNNKIANTGICPLCPGNEHMTPPAVLVYHPSSEGKITKEKDNDRFTFKDWSVRVIPNLYPVFKPPKENDYYIKEKSPTAFKAIGHHEVIIESSCHEEHLGVARLSQIIQVINAYNDRIKTLSKNSYVKHISIFRNHRSEAGASLAHPHSQLIATPCIPNILNQEKNASKTLWDKNCECCFCNILDKEKKGPRYIWENNSFLVFTPWASVNPLEFWIMPKIHHSNMLAMSEKEKKDLAEVLRVSLGGLRNIVNDPPYKFGFHSLIDEKATDYYHWHLEVYPRLSIWAGFEKSTGMFINVISPEDAALELSKSLIKEKKIISN
jgi:UDPglucose--hexose-1-phosphate uridylyltransferase